MYYPERMKARVSPHRILAPTRDSNQEPPGPQPRVVTNILPLHTTYVCQHPEYYIYVLYNYCITSFPCRYWQKAGFAGNAYMPARASFVGDAYTPANETADLVSLNMAAPVRSVSDMRINPKTIILSGVYIYNERESVSE